jgi:GR25 family glycosyltransferase involved in LPS biosynthesis
LGCGLSFVKIVKYAKENNLKTVLIFEDDNMPLDNFENRWFTIKNWLDNNLDKWEIFNGGARFMDWLYYNKKTPNPDKYDVEIVYKINNIEYLFQSDIMVSGNWIYINSNCYDKVINWQYNNKNNNDNLLIPMDQYITNKKHFKHVYCIPPLALQYNSKSDTANYEQSLDNYDTAIIELFNKIYIKKVSEYFLN